MIQDTSLYSDPRVLELEHKIEILRKACQDFVDKVDAGVARSVDSYAKFKEALELTKL